ncbi:MAG: esterase family protein, partial [Bacteroidales bacterium]|nr:esterase family protein [Bacteroidales bacterium]
MKKILLAAMAILVFLPARAGKVVTDSIRSKVLGADVTYNIYLPDGYGESPRHYPVIYLLHGL